MNDIIFWGANYDAFLLEAIRVSNKLVTNDVRTKTIKPMYNATRIVTNKRGEFMVVVRAEGGMSGEFDKCTTIENLGSYVAVFASGTKKAIYDRVYPATPYTIKDIEGNAILVTPPERFCEFGS